MTIVEIIRADVEEEMPPTRRVIERVPGDRGEWRPHPKSFPIGHLAQLVSIMPWWIANLAIESKLVPVPCTYGPTADDRGSF